ncbi:DUF4153 domain-containing protein [Aedoeadaptatus pacaensis]|uniref:DUF4153 domain-containing protein n=1 Tax=Aedoeadaptatus pacaensis TaxID=1776390 RepID=UPI000838C1FB|nr:DUF4153 domain-containing protein [Peptoniphilus pacaensis]
MRLLHLIAEELRQGKEAFRRFPLSMAFAILAAIFQCLWLHKNDAVVFHVSPYLLVALAVIGFFTTTAAYLFLEGARDKENFHSILLGTWMGILLFLVISGFRLSAMGKEGVDIYTAMPTLLLFAASGLMVFCGGKIHDERRFPAYVLVLLIEIAVAYLYAFVLFGALCLLVVGADVLFGIVDFSSAVMYLATICFMPFMATIFLSRLSAVESGRSPYGAGIHVINNLFNNILAPVLGLYVLLLYVYLAKILILRQLPTTSVVNLILWPMTLAVFVLFMVDHNRDRTAAYYFRKIIPQAALPLLGLMYYAWFLRVHQYGLTENRYMIFAVGLWVAFAMVHFIIQKRELHMILPMTLVAVLLVSVFGGPIGADGVAFRSQKNRLDRILAANHMLKGGEVVPSNNLSVKEKREIQEIVEYLTRHHDVSHVAYLRDANSAEAIERIYGFTPDEGGPVMNLNYAMDMASGMDISGYDKIYFIDSYGEGDPETSEGLKTERSRGHLTIYLTEKDTLTLNLKDVREKIRILRETKEEIEPEDLTMEGEKGGVSYKIYITGTVFFAPMGEVDPDAGISLCILVREQGK